MHPSFFRLSDLHPSFFRLSRQRELDAQAEVLRGRRITAARKQRGIGLTIVVETHGEQLAQGVIGSEAELQGVVATAGAARHRSDVADDGCLLAEAEVGTEIEVVVGTLRLLRALAVLLILLARSLHLLGSRTKEVEVVDAVAHTYHPILAQGLVHLDTRHTEVQYAGLAILSLQGHVVVKRHVHSEQWRECLVDAHLRHVEHAAWRWIARRGIADEAQTVHELLIGAETVVTAHRIYTLVTMVDVHTLEVVAEPAG